MPEVETEGHEAVLLPSQSVEVEAGGQLRIFSPPPDELFVEPVYRPYVIVEETEVGALDAAHAVGPTGGEPDAAELLTREAHDDPKVRLAQEVLGGEIVSVRPDRGRE